MTGNSWDTRRPNEGDYWCHGLLTADLLEAVTHASKMARELGEEVLVQRYSDVNPNGLMPVMDVVAIVRKP